MRFRRGADRSAVQGRRPRRIPRQQHHRRRPLPLLHLALLHDPLPVHGSAGDERRHRRRDRRRHVQAPGRRRLQQTPHGADRDLRHERHGLHGIQRRRCRGIRRKEVPGVLRQLQEDGEAPANPRRRAGRDARGFALRRNGPNREQRPAAGQERRDGLRRRVPEGVGRSQRLGVRGFQRPDGRNRPARAGRTTFVLAVDGRPHPPGQRRAHGDGLPLPQGTGLCRQGGGRRADRRGEREGSQGRQLRNHRPAQERPRNLVRLPGRSPALPARHPDARDGIPSAARPRPRSWFPSSRR